jgi:hypothetical protein
MSQLVSPSKVGQVRWLTNAFLMSIGTPFSGLKEQNSCPNHVPRRKCPLRVPSCFQDLCILCVRLNKNNTIFEKKQKTKKQPIQTNKRDGKTWFLAVTCLGNVTRLYGVMSQVRVSARAAMMMPQTVGGDSWASRHGPSSIAPTVLRSRAGSWSRYGVTVARAAVSCVSHPRTMQTRNGRRLGAGVDRVQGRVELVRVCACGAV